MNNLKKFKVFEAEIDEYRKDAIHTRFKYDGEEHRGMIMSVDQNKKTASIYSDAFDRELEIPFEDVIDGIKEDHQEQPQYNQAVLDAYIKHREGGMKHGEAVEATATELKLTYEDVDGEIDKAIHVVPENLKEEETDNDYQELKNKLKNYSGILGKMGVQNLRMPISTKIEFDHNDKHYEMGIDLGADGRRIYIYEPDQKDMDVNSEEDITSFLSGGEETWTDPAGGVHSHDEDDPAKMYEGSAANWPDDLKKLYTRQIAAINKFGFLDLKELQDFCHKAYEKYQNRDESWIDGYFKNSTGWSTEEQQKAVSKKLADYIKGKISLKESLEITEAETHTYKVPNNAVKVPKGDTGFELVKKHYRRFIWTWNDYAKKKPNITND